MPQKPLVVSIVGRQNVGKSTLFNALIKERRSIVDAHPGLTRDIITFTMSHGDTTFTVSDTPGLDLSDPSALSKSILDVAHRQLERSTLIVLILENPAPAPFDYEIMNFLRKLSKPVIVAVNKMDNDHDMRNISHFYELGLEEIIPISALRKRNIKLLLDKITGQLAKKGTPAGEPDIRIAIVGRPNSGKSTLLNAFTGYERSVVSDIPGTTRDSVDEDFHFQGKHIRLTDTAGLRRKSRVDEDIEFYSVTRTMEAITRSDTVIHLIDATLGLTENDKKISDAILKAGKNVIIAVNKWDAVEKDTGTFDEFRELIIFKFYRAGDFPILSISATEKTRIHRLLKTVVDVTERSRKKISTAELNRVIEMIQRQRRNPLLGDSLKIFYGTQTGASPPVFILFVNKPDLFKKDVVRHIQKSFQQALGLDNIPIFITIEGRESKNSGDSKKAKKIKKK